MFSVFHCEFHVSSEDKENKLLFFRNISKHIVRDWVALNAASLSRVIRRVEDWKLKLIDLSRRNRLIYFRPTKSSSIQFERPSMNTIFERLVIKDRAWEICQPPDNVYGSTNSRRGRHSSRRLKRTQLLPSEVEAKQLERILRNLSRRSVSEYRERGVRILYMTFGMLEWVEAGTSQTIVSPVVLSPVELTRKTTRDPYVIQIPTVEEEVILNPALRLKLQYDHKIELPSLPDFEEQSLTEYLTAIGKTLGTMGWSIKPVVQMGLFSFHKLVMYQDLKDNIDYIVRHPLVSALANVTSPPLVRGSLPREAELDETINPRKTFQVLDADSSQQLCIQYALRGQSFVMHGPPGTGKSQTIANVISEFIAAGKSVLFVSEKMAALEVVYSRLKAKGLDDFCLELHSHKANKREVVAELSRALTEHLMTRGAFTDDELDRLSTRRDQLNRYVKALHLKRSPIEMNAFQLFGGLAKLEETPLLPSNYPHFASLDQRKFFELEEKIRRISNAWAVVEEGDKFPWRGCSENRFTPETRSEWIHLLDSIMNTIQQLEEESENYTKLIGLPSPSTITEYEWLQRITDLISATPRPPSSWLEDADLTEFQAQAERNKEEWGSYWATRRALERFYDSRFLIIPPSSAERVESEWTRAKGLLAPVSKGDGGLLKQMKELSDYIRNLPKRLVEWKGDAEKIRDMLSLKGEVQTIETARRLSDLARLCEAEDRPERVWLDRKTLLEARGLLETLKADHGRRDELRRGLEGYQEEILSLDLEQLIDWFEGPGSSLLRYLRPSYYNVRRTISGVNRAGVMPETVLDDLKAARELVALEGKLASNREIARKRLGSFYAGEEPDFESAERALQTAKKALRIVGRSRAPKALRDNLCAGTQPSEEILLVNRRLRDSLSEWRAETRRLKRLIPARLIPTTERSMLKSTLQEVKDWAHEVDERLASLSRVSAEALATRISDHPASFEELLADMSKVEELQRFEDDVEESSGELMKVFGQLFNGLSTDWDGVLDSIDWTRRLLRTLKEGITSTLKHAVSEGGPLLPPDPGVALKLKLLNESLDNLDARFATSLWPEPRGSLVLDDIQIKVGRLRSRVDELQTWVDFNDLEKGLKEAGLGDFLGQLIQNRFDRHLLPDIFRKSLYQGLLDLVFEDDPTLKTFRGQDHEQLISDFQKLDRRFIQLSAQRVIEIANGQKPQGVFVQAPDSEITILMREAAKKRRHMPLRHLFDRIPNLIRRLKPCLMMSPISVSQFLIPGRLHFDLVVFDEASQIFTEDAVGAIYRGDQLIVAGDPKQLPPTPFFQYTVDEDFDWDESDYEFDVFDSVLDECMSIGLPVKMLRWHYRSKHDSLISFSNDRFYNGRLVLFPASRMGAEDLGLEFVHVPDGVYDRGGARNNPKEAEVVVDLVFDHFEKHPDKTLGVVTFSISQMNTVQDAIDRRLREHPEFERFFVEDRLHGFFVKNLENVQGDERDVMIFSVGYGYDQEGRITMNFGPLNKAGGERRLNVAITRAREKVILVSSIRYDDIKLGSTRAEGVHSLHHYMRYAEKRPQNLETAVRRDAGYMSPLEIDVAEEVRRLGYRIVPWVGSSSFRVDLGVVDPVDPARFILGIMCDGETYRTASMARDRDRLRIQVLESLGWRIHRIWSPDWVQRHETEIKRLETALKEAERGTKTVGVREKPSDAKGRRGVKKIKVREASGGDLPEVEHYKISKLKPRHLFSRYSTEHRERYLKRYHSEVRRLLPMLVKVEGPIHLERAFKRINRALRLKRATEDFVNAFREEVEKQSRRGSLIRKGDFLWSEPTDSMRVRVPVQGDRETYRPIGYIPPEEISRAMIIVVGHSLGLSVGSLINETAHLLGFKRMGNKISGTLTDAFETLKEQGTLILEDGLVTLADT
jgi:truncated hemoglobin YjbI